jgi:hypothetical protein
MQIKQISTAITFHTESSLSTSIKAWAPASSIIELHLAVIRRMPAIRLSQSCGNADGPAKPLCDAYLELGTDSEQVKILMPT